MAAMTLGVLLIAVAFAVALWSSGIRVHIRGATASQPATHKVVFTQVRNGRTQIFTMDSNGENLRQITAEDANTTQVSWSPDGKRLVFVNDIDGHEQIYRIDATGTRETRLTNDNMRDILPSWSPNGYEIAYLGIDGTNASIWIVNSDGTSPRKATDPSTTGSNIFGPLAWSPDGRRIAFASGAPDHSNIMLLTPKDGDVTQLTNLPGYATNPAWSPDGTSLVFTVESGNGQTSLSTLYTIRSDGTALQQITNGEVHDGRPAWSPDGSRIAFTRMTGRRWGLFVVNADGSNPHELSAAPTGQMFDFPSWSPEGQTILFVQHAFPNSSSGSATLEAVDADGGNPRTLTTTLAPDSWPGIRPPQP